MIYLYLILNLLTISFPVIRSFEHRIYFFGKWKYILPAVIIVGFPFILWDKWFTDMGVWSFSYDYTLGVRFLSLPIEEWLFFLTVPFACIFIYEVLNYFVKKDIIGKFANPIAIILAISLLVLAFIFNDRIYTFVTFTSLAVVLISLVSFFKVKWLGRFFLAYLVSMIPFFLVNGVLTAMPIVSYNDAENLGLRLYTIPIEDTMYSMLLLILNIGFYEYFKRKY